MKRKPEALGPFTVFNRKQLADWLQVSERTIDRLQPPAMPLGEGTKRYLLSDIAWWLQARKNGGKAA